MSVYSFQGMRRRLPAFWLFVSHQVKTLAWPYSVTSPAGDDWSEEDIDVAYQHTCVLRLRYFCKVGAALSVMTILGTLFSGEFKRAFYMCCFLVPSVALATEHVPIDQQISFWRLSCSRLVGPRLVGVVLVDVLNVLDISASAVAFLFDPPEFLNNGGPILMATNRFMFAMCSTSGVSTFLSCVQLLVFYACQQAVQMGSQYMMNLIIAFACVGITCHYNEVLACSIIRKEHVQNLRECAYSATLARLKTPLLLARSEMQALDQMSKGPAILVAQRRIEELWQMLTNLTAEQSIRPPLLLKEPADGAGNVEGAFEDRVRKQEHGTLRRRRGRPHCSSRLQLAGSKSEPLQGIAESEEECESRAQTWPGQNDPVSPEGPHVNHAGVETPHEEAAKGQGDDLDCVKAAKAELSGADVLQGAVARGRGEDMERLESDKIECSGNIQDSGEECYAGKTQSIEQVRIGMSSAEGCQADQPKAGSHCSPGGDFRLEPLVSHLQELARHIPGSKFDEACEILSKACFKLSRSPKQKVWEPCCGWKCELCRAMNDEEDTFCAVCLCEHGMTQDEVGNDIEEVP